MTWDLFSCTLNCVRHTLPKQPVLRALWPRYKYGCERCTLRWAFVSSVCPGCGHNLIRVEPESVRKAS